MGVTIIIKIIIAIAVAFIIVWGVFVLFRPQSSVSLEPYKGTLSKENIVGSSMDVVKNFYNGTGGGSFGVYIYLSNYDKSRLESTSISMPLIKIGGVSFYVNGSSDKYNSYLQIDKQGGGSQKLPLGLFPTQKWVYLTINREGRRFTVYYNGEVQISKNMEKMYSQVTDTIRIGGSSYIGTYAYPLLNSSIVHQDQIKAYIKKTANTRGEPNLPSDFLSTFGQIFRPCTGNECSKPIQAPSGKSWSFN